MAQYAQTTSDHVSAGTSCVPKPPDGASRLHSVTWVQTGAEHRVAPDEYFSTYRLQDVIGVWVWTWEIGEPVRFAK